jgi:glycosyl transferase/beta-hydroxylase protein BlmF
LLALRMQVALLCPTRGRAAHARRAMQTARDAAAAPENVHVYFYVDRDDPSLPAYEVALPPVAGARGLTIGAPVGVSKAWNVLAERAVADGCELLLVTNDDNVFETPGWDDVLVSHAACFPDRIFVAWFDDGINGAKHCAFPCVSRRWYRTLGYLTPDVGFKFFRNDTWIFEIGMRVRRLCYIPDVLVTHRHHSVGGLDDETTRRNRNAGQAEHDAGVWARTGALRAAAAVRLQAVMESR